MKIMRVCALFFSLFLVACAAPQLIANSVEISPGQTKQDVVKILGPPENRQFQGRNEAWQYCETDMTGFSGDDYVVVWFFDGVVTGMNNYKNTLIGGCEMFFRDIRWEDAPDSTIEIRVR